LRSIYIILLVAQHKTVSCWPLVNSVRAGNGEGGGEEGKRERKVGKEGRKCDEIIS
jgi:hypothetical protein